MFQVFRTIQCFTQHFLHECMYQHVTQFILTHTDTQTQNIHRRPHGSVVSYAGDKYS